MQRRVSAFPSVLLLLLLSLALFAPLSAPAVYAQPDASGEQLVDSQAALETLLEQGRALEKQRRWEEALVHYENSLKQLPGDAELKRRFQLARMHYGLVRRYNDSSFQEQLRTLTTPNALSLYSEVLIKLDSHYVDRPRWKRLVDWGTSNFEVALTDDVFQEAHLQDVEVSRINEFRRELRDRMSRAAIRSRTEARDAVNYAAWLAEQRLGVPRPAAVLEYLAGAATSLDDYSAFLTRSELAEVYAQIDGQFVGLGVELKADHGGLRILRVIPGSPAEKAGIRDGDLIVAVDGQPTRDLNADAAADLLQGPEGSTVRVQVVTGKMPHREVQVRREQVEVASVDKVHLVDEAMGIGYLRLNSFQKTTTREIDAALWSLHRQGMKSLIMDLRGNPGGLLTTSVEVVDRFVESGIIVSTRGRNAGEDYTYRAHRQGTWYVPLVVLIDGDSASASEIFAGAIRDHNRGNIVGTRSYGKGSVQGIFPLKIGGNGMRLTTAKFYSPNGKPFSKVGVEPSVRVQRVARPAEGVPLEDGDAVLEAAVAVARNEMARRAGGAGR